MPDFLELELDNIVYFKHAKIRFDENKITFVRGMNLDSTDHTSNASGKSLLLGAPSNVVYFSPPLSIKKKSKKELLGKNSKIRLKIKAFNDHVYDITQEANKYTILRDGKDLEIKRVPQAEKFIRDKIFPLSELEYYTYGYVSTQKVFKMQSDSDIDRLTHLTSIFKWDTYNSIHRFFLNKLGNVKEFDLKLRDLESELLKFKAKLKIATKKLSKSTDNKELGLKKSQLEATITKNEKELFTLKSTLDDLRAFRGIESKLDDLRRAYRGKGNPETWKAKLKEERSIVRTYDKYVSELASFNASIKDLDKKIEKIALPEQTLDEINLALVGLESKKTEAEKEIKALSKKKHQAEELAESIEEARKELLEYGYSKKNLPDLDKDYNDEIAGYRTTLRLKKLLDQKHDHKKGKSACPTCLSEVDLKSIRDTVARAEQKLPIAEKAQKAQKIYSSLLDYTKAKKELNFDESSFNALDKDIKKLDSKISSLEDSKNIYLEYTKLVKLRKGFKSPGKPEVKPSLGLPLDSIDSSIELCDDILKQLGAKQTLLERNKNLSGIRRVVEVEEKISLYDKKVQTQKENLTTLKEKLSKVVKSLDSYTGNKREHSLYTEQVERISRDIAKIKPNVADRKIFEACAKAYSPKGLKTQTANTVCSLLEQNLNTYVNLIFPEPFIFTVNATDKGLSIIADRGNGKVSDVRSLSGAESNCFRVLFVMALLPLIPPERKLNVLILDEPCAHMCPISRSKFINVFLPALSELIPNIFIITPNSDDYCEGSTQWVIRKHKGKSVVLNEQSLSTTTEVVSKLINKVKGKSKRASNA